MSNPDPSTLRQLFNYNPETGELSWKIKRGKCFPGKVITCRNDKGYVLVRLNDRNYRVHRIIWAMVYDKWPEFEIDHINGIRDDNKIDNLREATRAQNMKNLVTPVTNKTGFKGVSWHKAAQKWQAHIRADGINYYLGIFDNPEDAHKAYVEASQKMHGIFGKHQ
jgi:hypothetical protein